MHLTENDSNQIKYMKMEISRLLKTPLPTDIIIEKEVKDKYNELCNTISNKRISNKHYNN